MVLRQNFVKKSLINSVGHILRCLLISTVSISWSFYEHSCSHKSIEKAIRTDDPIDLPIKIAEAKAAAIIEQLKNNNITTEKLILTADQVVLFEQTIREKPLNDEEALQFLSSYSGKSVSTVSAIVITHYPTGLQYSGFDIATIHWKTIPSDIVEKVVAKKEIFNCAGGFRIEDEDLQPLIHSIDGSFDSVLGLPIKLTVNLLVEVLSYLDINDDLIHTEEEEEVFEDRDSFQV